jgi:chemotaxis signal transduction protein
VQYRGEILPLIDVSRELDRLSVLSVPANDTPESFAETISVVVYSENDDRVGLIVGEILDIVEDPVMTRSHANRPGSLFCSVVKERVTEFIDVAALVRQIKSNVVTAAS